MITTTDPWQNGPAELLAHAIEHLHNQTDFDQRLAFLLVDVGVETLLKTYLSLPEEVTGTKLPFVKRREAALGSFHDLVRGVELAAGTRLDKIPLSYIQYYHELRNTLYHQGNGITIPPAKVKAYAELAVQLAKLLLSIDLTDELRRPELEAERNQQTSEAQKKIIEEENQRNEQVQSMVAQIRQSLAGVEHDVRVATEAIEPHLLLPSFESLWTSSPSVVI